MKQSNKTESVTEFMARGGVINKVPAKKEKVKRGPREIHRVDVQEIDLSQLPIALKIKFGIHK